MIMCILLFFFVMGHASIPLQVRNKRYCGMNYTVNIDNDLISLKARHNRMVDDDVTVSFRHKEIVGYV